MDNEELAGHIQRLPRGEPLGAPLHTAIMGAVTLAAIEAVAMRLIDGRLHALLRMREADAPSNPKHWHIAGSFPRSHVRDSSPPRGEGPEDVLTRLEWQEGLGTVVASRLVGNLFWQEDRGWVCSVILLITMAGEPGPACRWFPVDDLPEPITPVHRTTIIPWAAAAFMDRHLVPRVCTVKEAHLLLQHLPPA